MKKIGIILLFMILVGCRDYYETGMVVGKDGTKLIIYNGDSVKYYDYENHIYNVKIKDTIRFRTSRRNRQEFLDGIDIRDIEVTINEDLD